MTIFAYHTGPAFIFFGESEGLVYAIDGEGFVTRKRYIFGQEDLAKEELIAICDDQLEAVKQLVGEFKKKHGSMPDVLDNGSLDGSFNEFVIVDRKIRTWNIQRMDLHETMVENRKYYDAYKKNIIAENALLDLAEEIGQLLMDCVPEMAKVLQSIGDRW